MCSGRSLSCPVNFGVPYPSCTREPFYPVVICTESKRQILMLCFAFCFILSLIHLSLKGYIFPTVNRQNPKLLKINCLYEFFLYCNYQIILKSSCKTLHFVTYKYFDIGENFGCMKAVMPSNNNFSDTARDVRKIRNVYMIFMYISSDHNKIIKTK